MKKILLEKKENLKENKISSLRETVEDNSEPN